MFVFVFVFVFAFGPKKKNCELTHMWFVTHYFVAAAGGQLTYSTPTFKKSSISLIFVHSSSTGIRCSKSKACRGRLEYS
jgi:hypothetical protein